MSEDREKELREKIVLIYPSHPLQRLIFCVCILRSGGRAPGSRSLWRLGSQGYVEKESRFVFRRASRCLAVVWERARYCAGEG